MYTMYIMINTISATEARNNFFELIDLVVNKGREFTVSKDGKPAVKITIAEEKTSPEERKKILAEFRKTFAKSAKRKYWSVIETPAWKKKEQKYLENLSKGILT
jgi:prevent-host-death family protein